MKGSNITLKLIFIISSKGVYTSEPMYLDDP